MRRALSLRPRDEWIAQLSAVGIPCSPLHTLGELSAHPHTRASGMVFDYDDPRRGPMHGVSQPIRFDGERPALRRPPPAHGEHGREILRETGFAEAEIERMASEGIVRLA